jgi:hypothetical protein
MGLDWNPAPKARPGHEKEFRDLWHKLRSKSGFFRQRKVNRFEAITLTAFETLATPRVGFDEKATAWAREKAFPLRVDKSIPEDVFVRRMQGFYVLELVPPCDGIPRYSNGSPGGYVERYSFRAQFLRDCEDIIGTELLNRAWESKLPEDTITYGDRLQSAAVRYAETQAVDLTKTHLAEDPDSLEFHLDVVTAAARWCKFWGQRGHWLEAYF